MSSGYLWVKAFHIVFVSSWFAGLFYLPRIFVNLVTVPADSHAERERLLMVPAVALGLLLWWQAWRHVPPHPWWLYAKVLLVVAAIGYHHACRAHLRRFEEFANTRSERWFRVFNEAAVVLFLLIVVLVTVKPF